MVRKLIALAYTEGLKNELSTKETLKQALEFAKCVDKMETRLNKVSTVELYTVTGDELFKVGKTSTHKIIKRIMRSGYTGFKITADGGNYYEAFDSVTGSAFNFGNGGEVHTSVIDFLDLFCD